MHKGITIFSILTALSMQRLSFLLKVFLEEIQGQEALHQKMKES